MTANRAVPSLAYEVSLRQWALPRIISVELVVVEPEDVAPPIPTFHADPQNFFRLRSMSLFQLSAVQEVL
jgi:hypothetical protein